MNVKKIIQLLIFISIIIFLFFFIKKTFFKQEINIVNIDTNKEQINKEKIIIEDAGKNLIKNLSYKSVDAEGNEYLLNAESGSKSEDDENTLILAEVNCIIKFKNRSDIKIKSDFAKYNSISFDTFFYGNVFGIFEGKKIYSDNLDLLFKDNLAKMYNNIRYVDLNTLAYADEISFNMLNGDINIKMFDEKEKINIIKN